MNSRTILRPCRVIVNNKSSQILRRSRPLPVTIADRVLSSAPKSQPAAVAPAAAASAASANNADRTLASWKEEHDARVVEAQDRVRARRQDQERILAAEQSKLSAHKKRIEERKIVLISVQHWLQNDEAFFATTMEALDLKLLQRNDVDVDRRHPNQQLDYDSDSAGDVAISRRGRKSASSSVTAAVPHKVVKQHPIQAVWDQYRQLYFDSIPEFREHLESNHDVLAGALDELQKAGFHEPQWSRRFRQVRGYRLQLDGMVRHLAKQRAEMQRREQMLRNAEGELRDLEEMERLASNNGIGINPFRSTDGKNERSARFKGVRRGRGAMANHQIDSVPFDTNNSKHEAAESSVVVSLFRQAWTTVSSLFGASSVATTSVIADGTDMASKKSSDDSSSEKSAAELSQVAPTPTQLRKRIIRKQRVIQELQDELDEAQRKLEKVQATKDSYKPPIPDAEHDRAQTVVSAVRDVICTEFARRIQERHAQLIAQYQTLDSKTDLTKPQEWYPYARLDKRKIIFHGGPTNSGKTYSALQRLKEAQRGLYLGPLRLLAAEVYETLTAEGIYTNLFTGQERREIAFSTHTSATVEMANTMDEYDVVVLDEIQMICDESRGAAWTKALLSLRCKEIHVCGGLEAKEIVEKISRACGDEFELHKYERFTELQVARKALSRNPTKKGAYCNVQPGDCVVAFSRNDIFAIKREIESATDYKCCVIYGKLPPQTRADQARRFNDPDSGYDVLVASDAIGMGLNLNIKRIIFNSIFKFNGDKICRLGHSEIKQISGRAGRRNSPYPLGEVSCRDPRDLAYIRNCLATEIKPIEKAALLPTAAHIEVFSGAIRAYNLDDDSHSDLYEILRQFSAMATVKGFFFLGRQTEMRMIAKRLRKIPIALRDAYTMCLSPTTENSLSLLESCAWKLARGEVFGLPSRSVPQKAKSFDDLSNLCGIYADADLFLWLQFKFPPSNAVEQAAALGRKEQTMEYINIALASTESLKLNHCYVAQATSHRARWEAENGPSQTVGIISDDQSDDAEYDEDDDNEGDVDNSFYFEEKQVM